MTDKENKTEAIEAEVLENNKTETQDKNSSNEKLFCGVSSKIISRILYSIVFMFVGWISLWVFGFVIIVQFGFLLITGQVNTNLKGFNKEVGLFLFDLIKFLSFQTDDKPFPFQGWFYGDENKNELNQDNTVKASK